MYSRVSTSTMYKTLLGSMQASLANIQDLQRQMTTQNKYAKLSDAPAAIARSLKLQSSLKASDKYLENGQDAISMLKYSEGALEQILESAQRIRSLVIQAGDGALSPSELQDIADQIAAEKQTIMDALNAKVAGKYIFGGADTSKPPFVMDASGNIRYQGSDERIKYALGDGLLGDVSFFGSEIISADEESYFICSHEVPLDWQWTGREEKVQITVGNRTLAVFIPEQWIDEVSTGKPKPTDYNQFRDPDEVRGISLDDLAMLINRSLQEQGADMLVTATVEKDLASGHQQMFIRSNTAEKIGITGWTTTDYMPMPQSIAGIQFAKTGTGSPSSGGVTIDLPNWNATILGGTGDISLTGLTGKRLTVMSGGTSVDHDFTADPADEAALISELDTAFSSIGVTASVRDGKLILTSDAGNEIRVDGTAAEQLLGSSRSSEMAKYNGIMGTVNAISWRDDKMGKGITIDVAGTSYTIDFDGMRSISDLVTAINEEVPVGAGDLPVASVVSGRLMLQSSLGPITVKDHGTPGGTQQLFGNVGPSGEVKSSTSSLSVKVGTGLPVKIYINADDDLKAISEKLDAIEGVFARTSADEDQLVVVARRVGALSDPLSTDAATEALHYPSLTIEGAGGALALFGFTFKTDDDGIQTGVIASEPKTRAVDHSHMDVFDVLGMETGMKSVEFALDQTLKVGELTDPLQPFDPTTNPYVGEPLHWRVMSGGHTADIILNPGEYSMDQLADRLKNAGAGWLEVTVDVFRPDAVGSDDAEYGLGTSYNREEATQRLVIRGLNGEQVLFLDMNDGHYADELGLSTALRAEPDMGVKDIFFPEAPCVDDALGVKLRVQMNCGMYYDVSITRDAVVDPETGLVDRAKVMREIVRQVNALEGEEIMGVTIPVDSDGKELPDRASIYFLSGEPFTVVDLPFSDPEWSDYSGGLAAQMGIHGGVTANMKVTDHPLKDSDPIGVTGTIRFSNLGHSVEIDVAATDTVKDVMDRLRGQAGDWLYVNYYDTHMGQSGRNSGDFPIIAISSVDGSAVNVTDVRGEVAESYLGLSTGIRGDVDISAMEWDVGETPGSVFSITVAGYTHTIDLAAMRDKNGNGKMDTSDLVETINARMQDQDVRAELNEDGYLVLWSPRGYTIEVSAAEVDADGNFVSDRTADFLGTAQPKTYYRGGYKLDDPASSRTSPGIHGQNATIRSGSNTTRQTAFGMLDDVIAAVKAGNREALSKKMLPRIDAFIDDILSVLSTNGALQNRYEHNMERIVNESLIMTEEHDRLVKVDLAEVASQLMLANYIYQANLGIISQMIQPSLLDFMR